MTFLSVNFVISNKNSIDFFFFSKKFDGTSFIPLKMVDFELCCWIFVSLVYRLHFTC